jgi:hypothetical protein
MCIESPAKQAPTSMLHLFIQNSSGEGCTYRVLPYRDATGRVVAFDLKKLSDGCQTYRVSATTCDCKARAFNRRQPCKHMVSLHQAGLLATPKVDTRRHQEQRSDVYPEPLS